MAKVCVVYRKGGTNNFTWHRSEALATKDAALDLSESVNRSGYLAHVEDYDRSVAIGLPETYDAQHYVAAEGDQPGDRPSPFVGGN